MIESPRAVRTVSHLLTDCTGHDNVFYELTIFEQTGDIKHTYSVSINLKGSFGVSVVCCWV